MIYILDQDPAECAKALDDKSLEKMIRALARALCNVHWFFVSIPGDNSIPLLPKKFGDRWTKWTIECKANYLFGVKLGLACVEEYLYRSEKMIDKKYFNTNFVMDEHESSFIKIPDRIPTKRYHDLTRAIWWARDNVPDLPIVNCCNCQVLGLEHHIQNGLRTPLPLVMPKRYQISSFMNDINKMRGRKECHIVESYRNYYQAKLKKSIKPSKHFDEICTSGCTNKHVIKWTRREKPEWLNL